MTFIYLRICSAQKIVCFVFSLLLLASCQSGGQGTYDESDYFQRRKTPEYIMEALPSSVDTLAQTEHFIFLGHGQIDSAELINLKKRSEKLAGHILGFSKKAKELAPIYWHIYPSCETKGLLLKNSAPIHFVFEKNEVHSIANPIFKNNYSGSGIRLILRQIYGEPIRPEIEMGIAVWNDEKWQGLGFKEWAARLYAAGAMPSFSEFFNHKIWENNSPLIYGTAAACAVDFFIEKYGQASFFEKYTSFDPADEELNKLEKEWNIYLKKYSSKFSPPIFSKNKLPYLQGFNFAHEGYRMYNGYGSQKAKQALGHLKNMGANSVAIVPYSYMRNAKKPTQIPVVKHPGAENDESVITSSEQAQALGFNLVLKPQIWLGGGQWPGDIDMDSEKEWDIFFNNYRHWIFHYAMLAEIYQWEALCVGTEMVQTSLKKEKEWNKIIEDIRKIYRGQLTYAANWGDEFEKTKIWDKLDFIGINCYYPLSQKEEPSDRELEKAFGQVVKKIKQVHEKYRKPIVFTEIGFASLDCPWKKPHEDWGDFEANEIHQARCYDVVFNSIKNEKWCGGILWWKYPSDLEHRSRRNTGFTPHNKLAEGTVEKWFSRSGE